MRAYEIYRRLTDRHEITIVCGKYPGARNYTGENVRYLFVGTDRSNYVLSTFCYAVQAARFAKEHSGDYDVAVEDFAPYNPVFSFLRHKNAVVQLHQREGLRHLKKYSVFGIPFFLIEKYYHFSFKNAVTISEMSKNAFGLGEKGVVIPNGFEGSLLDHKAEEGDYMLFLGRLHIGQKGLDTLAEACKEVRCRLVIAGGGKDEGKVRSLFSEAVGSGRVEFAGFVGGEEKTGLLGKCLFMVVPSRYEGQPLTVIEAAACGKPVVVSDIPELKYAVDAGFGISFKTGDAEDLAEKMNNLLGDQELRLGMGRKAREYAGDFSWDRIAEEYEKYLTGIVKETSGEKR